MFKKAVAGSACIAALMSGALATGVGITAASASTPVTYGFDGNAHLIVGGGSDTTYTTMLALGDLWQEDNTVNNVTTGTNLGDTCTVITAATQNTSSAYPAPSTAPIANQYSNHQVNTPNASPSPTAPSLTNCDHDTVAEAYPAGSSTGIAALNGDSGTTAGTYPYEGTNANVSVGGTYYNGYGTPDFARSSRQPKTSGGNCPTSVSSTNNELACDTFWGFASDEVQVFSWNYGTQVNRGAELADLPGGLTADDLYNIWNCNWTSWSQIPGLQTAVTAAGQTFTDGPIVPWQMNTGSGTESLFQSFIIHNASTGAAVPSSWNIDGQKCDRALSDTVAPFENDTKPLLTDSATNGYTLSSANYPSAVAGSPTWYGTYNAGLVDDPTSPQDPSNWIWWGSFGLMNAYPNLSSPLLSSISSTPFSIQAAPIYNPGGTGSGSAVQQLASSCSGGVAAEPACTGTSGQTPSGSSVGKYPLSRDLYIVTPKSSADCPIATSGTDCDLTGTVASGLPGDIQVNGATGGPAGAVREFIRFVCRATSGEQQNDPYTGTNYASEIAAAITANGFVTVPAQSSTKPLTEGYQQVYKQAGLGKSLSSGCSVLSVANTSPQP